MIHRLLGILAPYVVDWIFCTGYRRQDIEECIKFSWPAYSTFHNIGEDAKMCHRIKSACRDYKVEGRILVCYADELANVDLAALETVHRMNQNDITFTTYSMRIPFGLAMPQPSGAMGIVQPLLPVNIGFCVMEQKAVAAMRDDQDLAGFITEYANGHYATGAGAVGTYEHTGKRVTVNSLAEWEIAERDWA